LKGVDEMSLDVALMVFVLGGIGLSAAYVRAEYRRWRELGAAERRREAALRQLHAARLSEPQDRSRLPSVHELQGFSETEAANPDPISPLERGAAHSLSQGTHPFSERRKRERQRAVP
jgi:hypothetical protein